MSYLYAYMSSWIHIDGRKTFSLMNMLTNVYLMGTCYIISVLGTIMPTNYYTQLKKRNENTTSVSAE